MNIAAIICEYNPFHNGHLHQINATKKQFPDHKILCLLSGNFVQRGEIAIKNKYERARWAIENGVDIVVELPVFFAINTAETFAFGAVSILNKISGVSVLSFGSEIGDIDILKQIAQIAIDENSAFKACLKEELQSGISYPKAYANTLLKSCQSLNVSDEELASPNNILAIEYIKAITNTNSKIEPFTIIRKGQGYNDLGLKEDFSSASGIRNCIYNNQLIFNTSVPKTVFEDLAKTSFKGSNLVDIVKYSIETTPTSEIGLIDEVTEGLENRIKSEFRSGRDFNELAQLIKSKRFTLAKIKRILLKTMLKITATDVKLALCHLNYSRILAISQSSLPLLSQFTNIIAVTKKCDIDSLDAINQELFYKDLLATNIFNLTTMKSYNEQDFSEGLQIINCSKNC